MNMSNWPETLACRRVVPCTGYNTIFILLLSLTMLHTVMKNRLHHSHGSVNQSIQHKCTSTNFAKIFSSPALAGGSSSRVPFASIYSAPV